MSSEAQFPESGGGWWKFFLVVGLVLFVLAFVTFNLGLLLSFTVKRLLWGGLTTVQVWVSGVVLSVLLYGLIYVQLSPKSLPETEAGPFSFYGRIRRAARFYLGLNAVAFLAELIIFYVYGSEFLRLFLTTVFPVFTG